MAEGIYSPTGLNKTYARNRFGKKLLGQFPVVSIHTAGDSEGEFSTRVNVNGTSVIIPSVEGKSVEIIGYNLVASGASVLTIRSSGNDIFGPVSLAAGGQISNSEISLKGNSQEPIVLITTSQVGGFVSYRLV
jgi:hypothetical protein